LEEKKWIKKNPTANVKLLRDRKRIRETLEDDEIKKIASYLKKQNAFPAFRDLVIFQLLLDTGVRINECLNIQLKDMMEKDLLLLKQKIYSRESSFCLKICRKD
jgi:site-specific recombinase XerD